MYRPSPQVRQHFFRGYAWEKDSDEGLVAGREALGWVELRSQSLCQLLSFQCFRARGFEQWVCAVTDCAECVLILLLPARAQKEVKAGPWERTCFPARLGTAAALQQSTSCIFCIALYSSSLPSSSLCSLSVFSSLMSCCSSTCPRQHEDRNKAKS